MTAAPRIEFQTELPLDFIAAYEGSAVDAGTMRAKDFAGAVFAIAELVEQSAAVEFDTENAVALEIKADFRRGSFEFGLVALVLPQLQPVLASITPEHLHALLKHIGVIAGETKSLLALIKRKGPRPIAEVRVEGDHNVTLVFAGGDQANIETGVSRNVARLLQSEGVRKAAAEIVKPLNGQGVSKLRIGPRAAPAFEAEADEAAQFVPPAPSETMLTDSSARTALELLAPSFVDGNRWKVAQGGQNFHVGIMDEAFRREVEGGRPFAKGDYLIVELRTRTYSTPSGLRAERDVMHVENHRRGERQGTLL